MPDVSIVIPVYNEEGILREAVTELLDGYNTVRVALAWPELTVEVIVAENGSKARTVALADPAARHGAADDREPLRRQALTTMRRAAVSIDRDGSACYYRIHARGE